MLGKGILAAAAALAAWSGVGAVPPPVPVTPVPMAEDPAIAESISALVAEMSERGFFAAVSADPAPPRPSCADVAAMRATCYATAARATRNPNLVFLVVEQAGEPFRLHCIGPDQGRAQRADFSLAAATGDDEAAARAQRQALSSCLIGALHAPSVPQPPVAN